MPMPRRVAGWSATVVIALSLLGCGRATSEPAAAAPPAPETGAARMPTADRGARSADAAGAASAAAVRRASVRIGEPLAAHVKIGPVPMGERIEQIRVPGTIGKNIDRTVRVGSPIEGRVTRVHVSLGQRVAAGAVLAEVSSQELSAAQLELSKAVLSERLREQAAARARKLLEADVIGSAELQRRENDLEVATAEKRVAADQLRVLGLPESAIERLERGGRISATLPLTAARAGTVIERGVTDGQVVQPADTLFVVSDLSRPWALADVPEREVGAVRNGQPVEVTVPALGDRRISARITYVSDVVDEATRTVRVAAVLDNPDGTLKPRMLATLGIESRRERRQMVPLGAIVREGEAEYLFVVDQANNAQLRRVELGVEQDGLRPLEQPLPAGTRIVLEGAFHLNNARLAAPAAAGPVADRRTRGDAITMAD